MASQMYNSVGQQDNIFSMFGGYQNFMMQYNALANNLNQANTSPEAMVKQMLANGQISQEQFNNSRNMANSVWPYFNKQDHN